MTIRLTSLFLNMLTPMPEEPDERSILGLQRHGQLANGAAERGPRAVAHNPRHLLQTLILPACPCRLTSQSPEPSQAMFAVNGLMMSLAPTHFGSDHLHTEDIQMQIMFKLNGFKGSFREDGRASIFRGSGFALIQIHPTVHTHKCSFFYR